MKASEEIRSKALTDLCEKVRELVAAEEYEACCELICEAMGHYPNAPQPHNLMGVIMEKTGNHAGAMKHFRAAWALDPTFTPANHNLMNYGTFYSSGTIAFDECDCERPRPTGRIEYDSRGVGRFVRGK